MTMRTALIAGALMLGACASTQESSRPEHAHSQPAQGSADHEHGMQGGTMEGNMAAMCPMNLEGTTVRAEDVDGGGAAIFTTKGDVAELRRRVARMAQMHQHQEGMEHGREQGMQEGTKMGSSMRMPDATVRTEDIEGGARIILTPRDPAELASLREHVHQHAEHMASMGRCDMK